MLAHSLVVCPLGEVAQEFSRVIPVSLHGLGPCSIQSHPPLFDSSRPYCPYGEEEDRADWADCGLEAVRNNSCQHVRTKLA